MSARPIIDFDTASDVQITRALQAIGYRLDQYPTNVSLCLAVIRSTGFMWRANDAGNGQVFVSLFRGEHVWEARGSDFARACCAAMLRASGLYSVKNA